MLRLSQTSRCVSLCLCLASAWLFTSPASASRARAASDATVVLHDIGFHGSTARIHRGGHITWLWRDGSTPGVDAISHNVTSVGRPHFRGAYTRDHGSYRIRFDAAGTYHYECTIHYGMTGRIVVS